MGCIGDSSELWADMADVEGGAGVRMEGRGVTGEEEGGGAEGSAALSSLSWDDPVAPKAPLQLQVLQLLPELLPLLLLLLLTETHKQHGGRGFIVCLRHKLLSLCPHL